MTSNDLMCRAKAQAQWGRSAYDPAVRQIALSGVRACRRAARQLEWWEEEASAPYGDAKTSGTRPERLRAALGATL